VKHGPRDLLIGASVVLATLLGVWLVGQTTQGRSGPALSPTSDDRLGTSALVALAGELGTDVEVTDKLPALTTGDDPPDIVLLFLDLLDEDQTKLVEDWVDAGGTLVVTDPASSFAPGRAGVFDRPSDLGAPTRLRQDCEIDPLTGIDVSAVRPRHGGVLYHSPVGSDTCLDDGSGSAYVVVTGEGDGNVVAVGGAGIMVNAALAKGENAPVAAALLAPQPGTRLLVLEPGPLATTGGGRTLGELISPGVKAALLQLVLAFVVYALWRAKRLGRPVLEPQPVAVAGSELVAATGGLLDRSRSPQHAGELLRRDLRAFLSDRLGVPRDAQLGVLAAVAAERTGLDEPMLGWALGPEPVLDDGQLVTLARTIDRIREEVLTHV
jgi:Domain of unknown function (DUF4350)